MNIGMWDSLYNVILFLFWNIIWNIGDFDMIRNPMLAPIARIQNKVIDFLKPVLPFLPNQIIAAVALLFLIVFRGVAVPPAMEWKLTFGLVVSGNQIYNLFTNILFSFLSFAIFTFKIWAVSLIYIKTKQQASFSNNTDALFHLSKPFSLLEISIRPIVILIFGALIAYSLIFLGHYQTGNSTLLVAITQFIIISLTGLVGIIPIIRQLIFLMIIGSLFSSLTGSFQFSAFCRDGIDTLIGPLRRYPIRIGMFDLTPIVFIFLLQLIYEFLQGILLHALQTIS